MDRYDEPASLLANQTHALASFGRTLLHIMVSSRQLSSIAGDLDEETIVSIGLAVAQWMHSPQATSIAREQLRAIDVNEEEIEERRRCRSADRSLAAILKLAVTLLITRGKLEHRDRALIATDRDATIAAIVHATALAFRSVLLANSQVLLANSQERYSAIDLEIGDY